MFFEFLKNVPELLRLDWSTIAKMMIGAFMVGFLALGWVRAAKKANRAKLELEREKRKSDVAQLEAHFAKRFTELREEIREAETERDKAEQERARSSVELTSLQDRIAALESFDGKLWERDSPSKPPAFISMSERQTRFIAILNLKGGVGKTTLTANLGAALARLGRRVLIADLDFQGSLSRLCLSRDDLGSLTNKGRTISQLFSDDGDNPSILSNVVQRLSHPCLAGKTCDFVVADDSLAEAELRAQARWLVSDKPDARFLFRSHFHRPTVLQQYDYVLFDCPPRLTTACINALSCSDFLLVPVFLELGSVETLPRTLKWLTDLPHVTKARLLGVVANRVSLRAGKLIAAQANIYNYLPETVKRWGYEERHIMKAMIPDNRAMIEEAANHGRIAVLEDKGFDLFSDLACEVEKGVRG